eukprot:m.77884 g.77884  ORF g.77884 m.77884 type:complete len:867 (-) comp14490_c0_seq1:257-2857(-)
MAAPSETHLMRRRSSSVAISELMSTIRQQSFQHDPTPDNDMQRLINETMRTSQAEADAELPTSPLKFQVQVSPPSTPLSKQPPSYDMLQSAAASPPFDDSPTASPTQRRLQRKRQARLKAAYNNQRHHTPEGNLRSMTGSISSLTGINTYTDAKLDALTRLYSSLKNTNKAGVDVPSLAIVITKLISPTATTNAEAQRRERPLDEQHARKVMRYLDIDADGFLNFDEFCMAMDPLLNDNGEPSDFPSSLLAADTFALLDDLHDAHQATAKLRQEFELEKDGLLRDMAVAKQQMQARETDTVEQAHAELNGCYAKIRKLQEQLAKFRSNNDLSRVSPTVAEANVNQNSLQPNSRPYSPDAMAVEMEELKRQNAVLVEDYDRILAAHSALESQHETLQTELEEAEVQHSQAMAVQQQQLGTIRLLSEEIKGLRVELEDYRGRQVMSLEPARSFEPGSSLDLQAEIRLNELTDENEQLCRELQIAKEQVLELEEKCRKQRSLALPPKPGPVPKQTRQLGVQVTLADDNYLQELLESRAAVSELKDEAVRRRAQMFQLDKEYSARLKASQLEIDALRMQLSERAKPDTAIQMQISTLHSEVASLVAELNEVGHRNLTLGQQLRAEKDRADGLQAKLERQHAKTRRVELQLSQQPASLLLQSPIPATSMPDTPRPSPQSLAEVLSEINYLRDLQQSSVQDQLQRMSLTSGSLQPDNLIGPTGGCSNEDRQPTLLASPVRTRRRIAANLERDSRPPVIRLGGSRPETPESTGGSLTSARHVFTVDICESQAALRHGLVGSLQLILTKNDLGFINTSGTTLALWPLSAVEKISSYGGVLALYIRDSSQNRFLLYATTARASDIMFHFSRITVA